MYGLINIWTDLLYLKRGSTSAFILFAHVVLLLADAALRRDVSFLPWVQVTQREVSLYLATCLNKENCHKHGEQSVQVKRTLKHIYVARGHPCY